MSRVLVATSIVAVIIAGAHAIAQSPRTSAGPAFDVASVRSNRSGSSGPFGLGFLSGGRFTATSVTLQRLIAAAYGTGQLLPVTRIAGGPDWLTTDRFDIEAKATPDPPGAAEGVPRRFLMLRALLADRFRLAVRHEVREAPIYALVLARSDRRIGPRLRPVGVDCAAGRVASNPAAPLPPRPVERPPCGIGTRGNALIGGGATMSQLANVLSDRVDRIVVDKTNLAGDFDLDLAWTPIPTASAASPSSAPPLDPSAPSIFTAVQEQLGLKLESTKGPVDVLVIDRVERPTAD
jgi:uncharacterized protein (TIGR03435 family)